MVKKKIENVLKNSSKAFFKGRIPEIKIEYPPKRRYGNYSTTLPLELARKTKKNPLKIAQDIVSQISKKGLGIFEKIEIRKPGFINFFIKEKYLKRELKRILKEGENFGRTNIGKGKKVNIEFISANPMGPLHIGNGRGAFFGDTLANLLEMAGFKVTREYYVNDAKVNTQIQELGKTVIGEGKAYLTPYLESLIKKLKSHLEPLKGNESEAGYFISQNIQRDVRNFIKKRLKINFDYWISEQILYREGKVTKIFNFFKNKNLIYKKDRAWWLKTSKFGAQKDEVLIRKNGQSTYFLSDIAYHKYKIKRGYGKIINIWGADHQGHVKRMEAAMRMLGYKGDFEVLISQIIRLKGGKKLSKRKGEVIKLNDLIEETGLNVARYFYLSKSLSSQMEFDLTLAKEQSKKNPIFYIQYAYVRISSILNKSTMKVRPNSVNFDLLNHPSELNLIHGLIKFSEAIEDTVNDYQVHRLTDYGQSLASSFHRFYRDCQVLSEDKTLVRTRLALILATKIVLKNLFYLLGISAPKKM